MDRDEFMELVYETFADEPDNVLANGIIEAADAYAEHEKSQLFSEDTTSDLISRTEAVEHFNRLLGATVPASDYDEGFIDGVQFAISTVSTMPTIQPEPSIPVSRIEKYIEWLKSLDNEFANLAAAHISVMVKKWRDEKK